MNILEFKRRALGHVLRNENGDGGAGGSGGSASGGDGGYGGSDSSGMGSNSGSGGGNDSFGGGGQSYGDGSGSGWSSEAMSPETVNAFDKALSEEAATNPATNQPTATNGMSQSDLGALQDADLGSMAVSGTQSVDNAMASMNVNQALGWAAPMAMNALVPGSGLAMSGMKAAATGKWGAFGGGLLASAVGVPSSIGSLAGDSLQSGTMPSGAQIGSTLGSAALGVGMGKLGGEIAGVPGAMAGGYLGAQVGGQYGADLGSSMAPGPSNATPGNAMGPGTVTADSGGYGGSGHGDGGSYGLINSQPATSLATPTTTTPAVTAMSLNGINASLYGDTHGWSNTSLKNGTTS